jgi:hypothetical protein
MGILSFLGDMAVGIAKEAAIQTLDGVDARNSVKKHLENRNLSAEERENITKSAKKMEEWANKLR